MIFVLAPMVVRIVGQPNQGLVEMQANQIWRPVCKDYGDYKPTADLICKSLGYQAAKDYYYVRVNNQSGAINALIGLRCTGKEYELSECSTEHACLEIRQIGVICDNGEGM